MPKIQSHTVIDITPEKFLNACDSTELHEVELLLSSPRYRDRMDSWDSGEDVRELPVVDPVLLGSPRSCHQCGCTDEDCRQCIKRTGQPCHWVAENLCSACAENANPAKS